MNPEVVRVKFEATRKWEEELGFNFKTPIMDAISHLVDQLDNDSPFGKLNNSIQDSYRKLGEEGYMLDADLSYMGVEAKPGNLGVVICSIKAALSDKGIADCFMHGTTAANLGKIAASGFISPSQNFFQRHDFGPGVYCFKGLLEGALSYAFARSWPGPGLMEGARGVPLAKIPKDNPSVIVFPAAEATEKNTFHVGFAKYPKEDENRAMKTAVLYKSYLKKKAGWSKTNKN